MNLVKIDFFIKTACGREKFRVLQRKKGLLAKIRLAWFVLIATLRDFNSK